MSKVGDLFECTPFRFCLMFYVTSRRQMSALAMTLDEITKFPWDVV